MALYVVHMCVCVCVYVIVYRVRLYRLGLGEPCNRGEMADVAAEVRTRDTARTAKSAEDLG